MKNYRNLEGLVHGNPICSVTALITVGLLPPGAGAVRPEGPALLAALSFLGRHWAFLGSGLEGPNSRQCSVTSLWAKVEA